MTAPTPNATPPGAQAPQSRRAFLKYASRGLLGAGAALGLYAWRIEPHWLEFTHHDIAIPNLPNELKGSTLVQISDVHVGDVDPDFLMDSFRRIAPLEPDWIAITGDFMSCVGGEQTDAVARVFDALPPARRGRVGCLGNHDYGRRFRHADVADNLVRRMRDLGVDVLANETRDFGGLTFVGIDDYWGPRFDPESVLRTVDHSKANLVLCHNPDVADMDVWGGYRGWILAGHTHGGQCKPPFLPPPLLPVFNRRYTAGVFDVGGGRSMYINRALGHLTRVRFNVRPEIAVFRLT